MGKKSKYKVPEHDQQHNRVDIFRTVQGVNDVPFTISSGSFVNTAFVNSNDNLNHIVNTSTIKSLHPPPPPLSQSIITAPQFQSSSRNISSKKTIKSKNENENIITESKYKILKIVVLVIVIVAILAIVLALALTLTKSSDYLVDSRCPQCKENEYCIQNSENKPICVCRPGYISNNTKCVQVFCYSGYIPYSNITENKTYGISLKTVNNSMKPFCCPNNSFSNDCCGVPSNDIILKNKRIIGGSASGVGNWPWLVDIVQVYRTNPNDNISIINNCSGALISDRHVLTAAHCVVDDEIPLNSEFNTQESLLRVHFGFTNKSSIYKPNILGLYERNVSKIIIHEEFDPNFLRNDIAILKLDKPIDKQLNVDYICLFNYEFGDKIVNSEKLYVAGWGSTSMDMQAPVYSDTLQFVDLDVLPIEDCFYINGDTSIFNKTKQVCAGYKVSSNVNKDTCNGDSGSPLMVRLNNQWFHYGIVSYGSQKDCGKGPAIYTRTAYFYDWIQRNKN